MADKKPMVSPGSMMNTSEGIFTLVLNAMLGEQMLNNSDYRMQMACGLGAALVLVVAPSCETLGQSIPIKDAAGTVVGETTVGEVVIDGASDAAGAVVTGMTGSPMLGAAAAALLVTAAAALRKKKS